MVLTIELSLQGRSFSHAFMASEVPESVSSLPEKYEWTGFP